MSYPKESGSWKSNFILYLAGRFFLGFGDEIFTFTVSFFIMYQTGSALYASINLAIFSVISLLFLPLAGVVSDSKNKKSIIVFGELIDPIILIGLFIYTYLFGINIVALYITTGLLTLTSSFVSNAFQSSITRLFAKEDVQKVYGYTSTLTETASLSGPIVAGALIGLVPFEGIIIFFIVFNMVAVSFDLFLNFEVNKNEETINSNTEESKSFINDIIEGVKYIFNNYILRTIVIYLFFVNFITTTLSILPSKMLIDVLELPSTFVGVAYAALSLGGIIGGLIIGNISNFQTPLLMSKKFSLIVGLLIVVLPLPIYLTLSDLQNVFFVSIMFIILSISVQFVNTPILSFYQTTIPDYIKGRVFSLITVVSMMTMPIGFLFFGFFYDLGAYFTVNLFAGSLIILSSVLLLKNKVISKANISYQEEIEREEAENESINVRETTKH